MDGLLGTISGMPVIASASIPEFSPKMVLSNKVTVSDEFREKQNKWLLDFFGVERTGYMVSGSFITHPNTVAILKSRTYETNQA